MTVESNYAIAIYTLGDWLQNLAPLFNLLTIRARESGQPRGARQPDEPNWFIALLFVII